MPLKNRREKLLRKLGFSMWIIGVGLTLFVKVDMNTFYLWFSGLCIYFWFDIRGEKERARIVQEAQ